MSESYTSVSYSLVDDKGGLRGRGIVEKADAIALAEQIVSDSVLPLTIHIEKVTFTGIRAVKRVATVDKVFVETEGELQCPDT